MTNQNTSAVPNGRYRLLFYNDSKGFGGHEVASITLLHELLKDRGFQITVIIREDNKNYASQLMKLSSSDNPPTLHTYSPPRIRYHKIYHILNPGPLYRLSKLFRQCHPHGVLVSQGNLEVSALGVLAAKQAGLPCLSYIPMAHTAKEMGLSNATCRDYFNHFLIHKPTHWLTCSQQQATRLRRRGALQPIDIIPNPIAPPGQNDRLAARHQIGIPNDALVIGMAGRLNNKQKGCDIFVQAINQSPASSLLRKANLLFIGDGEDWPATRQALEASGWAKRIFATTWIDKPEDLYSAFDLLVMPSRYEGLPLVMQEAILCNVPVASTQVDGLDQELPEHWCCPPGCPQALLKLIETFILNPAAYRSALPALQKTIRQNHTPEAASNVLKRTLRTMIGQNNGR